ncbi:hypothetical protein AKJ65_06555 [candidate division MSBL1 archaeon SCGC-AAA259E19]|uniref:GTP-dependent dephospho-CoA kinase n=2 Tax=candidate division MSBL1 TaxID=215777 RepID=A0A133V487_9EURY|nr:hypothetical protein AKJ65_06555 [candidate division MSBL1 archaeon SCGC-AAA259E19]KXB01237.1 hypothetical protein AKJ41_02320 [candidate division MSBL1 archaeon SCGC-AAA259O05]
MLKLPEDKRSQFKEPKGRVFKDTQGAIEYLDSLDYERIMTVGDVVSAEFLKNGVNPDIVCVDFTVMRSPVEEEIREVIEGYSIPQMKVENPPSYITEELEESIKQAEPPLKIVVEGEEDLAAVPAVLYAPENSIVAYGQPSEGVVLIEVSKEKKREFSDLLSLFEKEKD